MLTIVLTVGASAASGQDVIRSTASVTDLNESDPDSDNDTATQATSVVPTQADIQVVQVSRVDGRPVAAVEEGEVLEYIIIVRNNGPRDVAGARLTDIFPATLNDVTWTATTTSGNGSIAPSGAGNIDQQFDLTNGSVITLNVQGTVVGALTPNQTRVLTNTVVVTSAPDVVDSDLSNNRATESDLIVAAAVGGSGIFEDNGNQLGAFDSFDVALGDLDADGDMDAFVANFVDPNQVWLNNGNAAFSTLDENELGNAQSFGVSLGDVDSDGDLDAFVANGDEQPNQVWINNGNGRFARGGPGLGNASSFGVALGDIDGDGDPDALVANGFGQPNTLWINNGGNFIPSDNLLGNSFSQAVRLGDLDDDGDLDAFVANYNQPNRVWINNGGSFLPTNNSLGNAASLDVELGDLDDDGDLDALVANGRGQANQVWINNGQGSFSAGDAWGDSRSYGVSLGDLDGDGDMDAFIANANQANRVWLNNGEGSFSETDNNLGDSTSLGVGLGDLDGDGDLDAYVANFNQPNLVWTNRSALPIPASRAAAAIAPTIGFAEFLVLADHYGQETDQGFVAGDWDANGRVDAVDLLLVAQHFGKQVPTSELRWDAAALDQALIQAWDESILTDDDLLLFDLLAGTIRNST